MNSFLVIYAPSFFDPTLLYKHAKTQMPSLFYFCFCFVFPFPLYISFAFSSRMETMLEGSCEAGAASVLDRGLGGLLVTNCKYISLISGFLMFGRMNLRC